MCGAESEAQQGPKEFRELLERSPAQAAAFLVDVHPADAADWLNDVDAADARRVFDDLDAELQAAILEHADEPMVHELVAPLSPEALREIVEELPSDEAVDVLAEVDERVAEDVLEAIEDETAQELRDLAAHDPEVAGGVMTTDFVTAEVGSRIGDAVKAVKKEGEEDEEGLGVFVIDGEGRPIGYLSEHALLSNSIHDAVADVMVAPFLVSVDEDREEAAGIITKYGLNALAVVGDEGVLLGVISADDAQEILEEEVTEDVHRLVGTSGVQQTRLPILTRVRQRLPLMAVTVAGGLASAKLLSLFIPEQADGAEFQAILRYLPLIVGLAGNVGVQSSTILVRAFATKEVEPDRELSVLGAEVGVGAIIGLFCGLATLFVAAGMEGVAGPNWGLGYSVGLAIVAAVVWAALLGCVVPMGCRRLGIDPAIVAGPFLICLSDISGVGIYIVVASLLLGLG